MHRLILFLSTGCYSGYLPIAPGTWGSMVGLVMFMLMHKLSIPVYLGVTAAIFFIGVFVAGETEKIEDNRDPGIVVIDEIAGMLVTMIAAPATPLAMALGFFIFRVFDVLKPFPIRLADQRLHGGIGIMLDDILAGIYSLIVLQLILRFIL